MGQHEDTNVRPALSNHESGTKALISVGGRHANVDDHNVGTLPADDAKKLLGFAGRGSFVKEFEAAVFGAKPGDFLEVKTQFGYHVVHVIDRRTTTLEQATPELRRTAVQKQRDQRVGELMSKVARDLNIKVNPRFGRWDSTQLQVLEASPSGSVSSPAASPGGNSGTQPGAGTPSP